MRHRQSWKITDEFWEAVKHLIPVKGRYKTKEYKRKPGGAESRLSRVRHWRR